MIPRTYPTTYETSNGRQQMVVYVLSSVSGLDRWVDYIPVKEIVTPSSINTTNNNGAILVDMLDSLNSKQAWKDYIPVYLDASATDAWQVSSVGFIPVNGTILPITVEYLDIQDSEALPQNILSAENSVDSGNNTGWVFV
jgi:hypothetical protein